jgi:hypothetical protein
MSISNVTQLINFLFRYQAEYIQELYIQYGRIKNEKLRNKDVIEYKVKEQR